ncbi:MAG: cation:proton antiporter [Clostridia bacterium]|nr:cation:proton antiporter [Clostridia bacterium]
MQILLPLSLALFAGLMLSRVTKIFNLPAVTAYLVAGILIGPFCLGAIGIEGLGFNSLEQVHGYKLLSEVALGFIAFTMGNEFRLETLKHIGKKAVIIAIFQALVATAFVDVALYGVHLLMPDKLPLSAVLTLGAVATATAPAATLMVVKQYKADGPLTKMLLPVVALDDMVGLVVFAVSFGISKSLELHHLDVASIVIDPILEVVCSLLLGAIVGLAFHFIEQFFHSRSKRMSISVMFVFLAVALSQLKFDLGANITLAFSPLLVCMAMGTIFCNLCDFSEELMDRVDRWTGPLMVLFFVLSGCDLDFAVFSDWAIIVVGVVYIIFRSLGKIYGAQLSAKMTKCDPTIQKYLGITLLPQAGVSLGMSLTAMVLPAAGPIIRNVALFAVLIYELVGPLLTRIALEKAGEIKERPITEREKAKLEKKNKEKTAV